MTYPNWFEGSGARENFERHLLPLANTALRCVQIGAYTGDASKWMVDNILQHETSVLIDVDTWKGSDEPVHKQMDWDDVWNTYFEKNKEAIDTPNIKIENSTAMLFAFFSLPSVKQNMLAKIGNQINKSGNVI